MKGRLLIKRQENYDQTRVVVSESFTCANGHHVWSPSAWHAAEGLTSVTCRCGQRVLEWMPGVQQPL